VSAGRAGTGLSVRAAFRILRAHYRREDLLPGRGHIRPLAADPVPTGGWLAAQTGRLCALLLATVSFRAPWRPTGLAIAPAQMDTPGWLSAPGRECREANQLRSLAVEASCQPYIKTVL